MSIHKEVLIRSVQYFKDKEILDAFLNRDKNHAVPLYYQYSAGPRVSSKVSEGLLIGEAMNIRVENGMIVCDVFINDLSSHSIDFQGVIDNFTLSQRFRGKVMKNKTIQKDLNTKSYDIVRFVIYDKKFKEKVDEKIMGNTDKNETNEEQMSICTEIAAAESIPELHKEAPKAN